MKRRGFFARLVGGLAFAFSGRPRSACGFVLDYDGPESMPSKPGVSFRVRPVEDYHEAVASGLVKQGDSLEYRITFAAEGDTVYLREYRFGKPEDAS